MNRGMLWQSYQQLLREKRALEQDLVILKTRIEEVLQIEEPGRRVYRDVEREHGDRGRAIGSCKICGQQEVLHARGMCRSCYNAWYHRTHTRPQRLGSRPLTKRELQRLGLGLLG